jgi:SAM-dependent methyltransferase
MTWEEAVLWLRRQPEQAELVRACYYDDPLLEAAERFRASREWFATRALLPAARGRALDLGAGRGIASYALARDGWSVTAAEPDPSAVVGAGAIRALFADAQLSIDVRTEPGERLPFPDGSFDLVYGRAVMHHARDLRAFCREVRRVLRPGGTFLGVREHVVTRSDDLPAFLASHPLHRLYGGENAFRLDEYRDSLSSAGLRVVRLLNPWASDVNLHPESREQVRAAIAARRGLPAWVVPAWLLPLAGSRLGAPGRLYSFVCRRPRG